MLGGSSDTRVPPEPLLESNLLTWVERAVQRDICPGWANRHPIESLARGGSAKLLSFTKKTKFELWSLKTFQKNQALSGLPSGLRAAWSTCQYRIIMILCSIESLVQAALAQLLAFTKKIKFESQRPLGFAGHLAIETRCTTAVGSFKFEFFKFLFAESICLKLSFRLHVVAWSSGNGKYVRLKTCGSSQVRVEGVPSKTVFFYL